MTSSNGQRHPRLLNLTPHPIRLVTIDGHLVQLPAPNDPVPRIAAPTPPPSLLHTTIGVFNWHQMTTPPTVLGLPNQQAGVLLVVSRPVALAAPDRPDLIVPDQQHRRPDGLTTHAAALTTYPTHHTSPTSANGVTTPPENKPEDQGCVESDIPQVRAIPAPIRRSTSPAS